MAAEDLLERAGELKRQLVAFSQQPRYDRAFREMSAQHGDDADVWDEDRSVLLWDHFLLEYRLRNGRTVVEQFVDARSDLSPQEQQMLLGWRDAVSGPFEVQRRDGPALLLVNLVDDLTYRARSTVGPSIFRRMPRRSFLTRLVAVGDEWMFSGPTSGLFRRLLKRPRFDWVRDGEKLLRSAKPDHFAQPPRPQVTPVSERLAAYAGRR
jgi:hypothetical protein